MTPPPLTIGVPVYNGERFLHAALDSILGQTFSDFVLVVSDNASTDATAEIVEEYVARDDRVVLLRSDTNRGAAWNYNRVFAECRTPYFKWAAGDDLLAPTYLERLLEVLDAAPPSVVLAYPEAQLIDEEDNVLGAFVDKLAARPGAASYARLFKVVNNAALGNVIFSVVRSDALRRTRLHGNYPSADYVLLAELALVGEFRVVHEPLFLRRVHEQMSTRANPTAESLTRWFDTRRPTVTRPKLQLFREYLAAIGHAPLSRRARALSYLVFFPAWIRTQLALRTRARALLGRSQG